MPGRRIGSEPSRAASSCTWPSRRTRPNWSRPWSPPRGANVEGSLHLFHKPVGVPLATQRRAIPAGSCDPMPQIFHRSANTIAKVSIFGAVFAVAALLGLFDKVNRSPWMTEAHVARDQPIQFSHERHVAGNGIDCRYCHTSVERSAFAGLPPTKI